MTAILALVLALQDQVEDPRTLLPFGYAPVSAGPSPVQAEIETTEGGRFQITMRDADTVMRPARPGSGPRPVTASGSEMLALATDDPLAFGRPNLTRLIGVDVTSAGGDHRTLEPLFEPVAIEDTAYPIESCRTFEVSDGANDFPELTKLGDPNRVRLTGVLRIDR